MKSKKKPADKLLNDLTRKAGEKKITGEEIKKNYDALDFEDASEIPPKYVQTVYLYINGSVRDSYEVILN